MACGLARAQSDQRVVLVVPAARDAVLSDTLHRLRAELELQHWSVLLVRGRVLREPATKLRALAERHVASAAIALQRSGGSATLEVWLRDPAADGGSLHTLSLERSGDAALIALRAVDLLRSSLEANAAKAAEPNASEPSGVVQAEGEPSNSAASPEPGAQTAAAAASTPEQAVVKTEPAAATATPKRGPQPSAAEPAPEAAPAPEPEARTLSRLWITAEGQLSRAGTRFGFAYGPSLGVFYRALPWFELGAIGVAPLLGTRVDTALGAAQVWQESVWLEARLAVLRAAGFGLWAMLGGGAYFLQAHGTPKPPLLGRDDKPWSSCATLGLRAQYTVTTHLAIALSARARALYPRLGVQVYEIKVPMKLPVWEATAGLALGF
jgi:hypothetical protein